MSEPEKRPFEKLEEELAFRKAMASLPRMYYIILPLFTPLPGQPFDDYEVRIFCHDHKKYGLGGNAMLSPHTILDRQKVKSRPEGWQWVKANYPDAKYGAGYTHINDWN